MPERDFILKDARGIKEWIVELRRRIHRTPELSYQEFKTSSVVRETLDELHIEYKWPIAETGVVGQIGTGEAPCVALRADMDALPITEEADVDFKSEIAGRMHACGHDCHTSMLLGAARLLKEREVELPGTIKLIFQPAEEGGAGADRMCAEGVLDEPTVERIFGVHVWPGLPTGKIGGRPGTFLAAAGVVSIKIIGTGGHAAMPHLAVDPVVCASKLVVELQTLVSRELDPLQSGVVSITMFNSGTAHNVIPPEVDLKGTIRSLTLEGLELLQKRIREVSDLIARAGRCRASVEFPGNDYPPTVNDEECWQIAGDVAVETIGVDAVSEMPPVMGGEDFSYYGQRIPACFVGLGIRNEEVGSIINVHHPRFIVDEDALPIGSALHAAFAIRSLVDLRA